MSLSRALSLPLCASRNLATRAISKILVNRGLLRVPESSTALVHRKMSDTVMPKPSSMCHAVDGCLKLTIQYTADDSKATDQTFSWQYDEESNTYTGVFTARIDTYSIECKSNPIPYCEYKFLMEPSLDRESNTVTIEKIPIPYAHYFNN